VKLGSDAIGPIPPNGFVLAARLHFVLSRHVAFPGQNSTVLARATKMLAQPGLEWMFVEPGNPTKRDSPPMDL